MRKKFVAAVAAFAAPVRHGVGSGQCRRDYSAYP